MTKTKLVLVALLLLNGVLYAQTETNPKPFNINASWGNTLSDPNFIDREYQIGIGYEVLNRLNVGIYYGFNKANNKDCYIPWIDVNTTQDFKYNSIGMDLKYRFLPFKKGEFNNQTLLGLYFKGAIEEQFASRTVKDYEAYSYDTEYTNIEFSLGCRVLPLKHLGAFCEFQFLNIIDGKKGYFDNPQVKAGIFYRFYKRK